MTDSIDLDNISDAYILIGEERINVTGVEIDPAKAWIGPIPTGKSFSIWKVYVKISKHNLTINFERELTSDEINDRMKRGRLLCNEMVVHYDV